MSETILTISHLRKDFGSNQVLKDVDFQVEKGDVTCIIGASGSGKSTLLRCINLLETPTSGSALARIGYSVVSPNKYCFACFNSAFSQDLNGEHEAYFVEACFIST